MFQFCMKGSTEGKNNSFEKFQKENTFLEAPCNCRLRKGYHAKSFLQIV